MNVVQKRDAIISGTGEWKDSLFTVTGYYIKGHKPAGIFHYTDATLSKRQGQYEYYSNEKDGVQTRGMYSNGDRDGLWLSKYSDGRTEDSTFFDKGAAVTSVRYYYYPDKHLQLVTEDDVRYGKFYALEYTNGGQLFSADSTVEDYTNVSFAEDTVAQFPGGAAAWTRYISKQIMAHIDELTDKDYGTVLLRFYIDTSGNISNVRALTMSGSVLAGIGIRGVEKGPAWIPARQKGRKVKVFRIQPFTLTNPDL
jgi:antitoxin component YwqK of YwqJK toxin-antitoxin module